MLDNAILQQHLGGGCDALVSRGCGPSNVDVARNIPEVRKTERNLSGVCQITPLVLRRRLERSIGHDNVLSITFAPS